MVGFVEINLLRPGNRPGMVKPRLVADIGIAVLSQYRHRGIGRRLMEAAESWARSRGAASITLNCHAANEEAVSFYGSIGYRTIGLFMVKPLGTTDQASGYDAESSPRS